MKYIIELSEEDYTMYSNDTWWIPPGLLDALRKAKTLPEGHGRIIDADALEKKMCDREKEIGDDKALWESSAVSVALDMFAQTIIEAERSEEK